MNHPNGTTTHPHPRRPGRPGSVRAGLVLLGFFALTLPLMPLQALALRVAPRVARSFPTWYHRRVCRLLGIRVHVTGAVAAGRPVLLVSNHVSWLDIPVLSSVAPLSFIAKREVGTWPLVAQLARLQRTVFVDRTRRSAVGETTNAMAARLGRGDTLVLFAEGTSSDGRRVLPFKTSLFAAAKPSRVASTDAIAATMVQTVGIAYTHVHGLPIGPENRALVGWYGDMEMADHAWALLKAGPIDVRLDIGPPVALDTFLDRKALAEHSELRVRAAVTRLLRDTTTLRTFSK